MQGTTEITLRNAFVYANLSKDFNHFIQALKAKFPGLTKDNWQQELEPYFNEQEGIFILSGDYTTNGELSTFLDELCQQFPGKINQLSDTTTEITSTATDFYFKAPEELSLYNQGKSDSLLIITAETENIVPLPLRLARRAGNNKLEFSRLMVYASTSSHTLDGLRFLSWLDYAALTSWQSFCSVPTTDNPDKIKNLHTIQLDPSDPFQGITINPHAYPEEIAQTEEFKRLADQLFEFMQQKNPAIFNKLQAEDTPLTLTYAGKQIGSNGDDTHLFYQQLNSELALLELNTFEWEKTLEPLMQNFQDVTLTEEKEEVTAEGELTKKEGAQGEVEILGIKKIEDCIEGPAPDFTEKNHSGLFTLSGISLAIGLGVVGFGLWATLTHAAIGATTVSLCGFTATVLTGIVWPLAITAGVIALGSCIAGSCMKSQEIRRRQSELFNIQPTTTVQPVSTANLSPS